VEIAALTGNLHSTMTIVVVDIPVTRHSMVPNIVEISLLGGTPHIDDVPMIYLTETIQLLGGQHLLGGNAVTADRFRPATNLVNLALVIVIRLSGQIANVIAPFKRLVLSWIWMKLTKMTITLALLMTVNPID
jgi:hypothetical protein